MDCQNEVIKVIEKRKNSQSKAGKKYYEKNKDYIIQRKNKYIDSLAFIECACGSKHKDNQYFMRIHFNTIKHQKYVKYVKEQAELGLSAENYLNTGLKGSKLFYSNFPKIYCPCGGRYNSYEYNTQVHFISKRHKKWIQEEKWKEERIVRDFKTK